MSERYLLRGDMRNLRLTQEALGVHAARVESIGQRTKIQFILDVPQEQAEAIVQRLEVLPKSMLDKVMDKLRALVYRAEAFTPELPTWLQVDAVVGSLDAMTYGNVNAQNFGGRVTRIRFMDRYYDPSKLYVEGRFDRELHSGTARLEIAPPGSTR